MERLLWFVVPVAVAIGTTTLWHAPRLTLEQAVAAGALTIAALCAHEARVTMRWLGLGQSLMGAVQAFSWLVVGPWTAMASYVEPMLRARRWNPQVQLYNTASLLTMSCVGWWAFVLAGGEMVWNIDDPVRELVFPVALGALAQLLANLVLVMPGLAVLRGHGLRALAKDSALVLRSGWFNQIVGGILLAVLAWAVEPHGVGLVLAAVPLLVHMAVVNAIETAETGQERALRTLTRAAQTRDPYVEEHGARVAAYARELGRHLRLGPNDLEQLDLACRLHDIGFVAVPQGDGEPGVDHAAQGARMLEGLPFLDAAAELIRRSHEPLGATACEPGEALNLDDQPLAVLQVADAVDAVVSARPGITVDEVADLLARQPHRYSPEVVGALRSARPLLHQRVDETRPEWWTHDLPEQRGTW